MLITKYHQTDLIHLCCRYLAFISPSHLLITTFLLFLCIFTPFYAQSKSLPDNTNLAIEQSNPINSETSEQTPSNSNSRSSSNNLKGVDLVSIWNVAVQTLTLIVVLIYTIVTRQMQQVMARQIKLGVMPSFILGLVQMNMKDITLDVNTFALQITNVGSGTALNIEVEPVHFHRVSNNRRKLGEPNLRFNVLGLLRRDDKALIKHRSYSASQPIEEDLMVDLEEQYMKPDSAGILFTINFQDIEGDWYQQKVRVSHAGSHPSAVRQVKG